MVNRWGRNNGMVVVQLIGIVNQCAWSHGGAQLPTCIQRVQFVLSFYVCSTIVCGWFVFDACLNAGNCDASKHINIWLLSFSHLSPFSFAVASSEGE